MPSERVIDSLSLVAPRGVGKIFPNGTRALAGLDLEVREGEFLSLLGPSGCGKSTALRIIAGLSEPTQGAVEWPATATEAQSGSRIGFVFQEPTLTPWASVHKNVALPLKLTGAPTDDAAACVGRARSCRLAKIQPRLSARIVGRHAHARVDRACAGHRAGAAAHGRTVRRARRDHALQAQRRSLADVAGAAKDGGVMAPIRCSSWSTCRAASW